MKNPLKLFLGSIALVGLISIFAFRNANLAAKVVSMVKVYTTASNDYEGAIVTCLSNGKAEITPLLAHKGKAYLTNDKKILTAINAMLENGYILIQTTSASDGSLNVTTYIFEN